MEITIHDEVVSTLVALAVLWIMLGGIAHMLGGTKWASRVWNAPFRLIGSIIGWVLGAVRGIIAASVTGTARGIRDGWRARGRTPPGGGGGT